MSHIETKAYRDDPNKAISDATAMFKEIEAGKHDTRIRQRVTSIRATLSGEFVHRIKPAIWRERRTHIANPHYEKKSSTVKWNRKRKAFKDVDSPVLVMPHPILGYEDFFDKISDRMESIARRFGSHV